MKSPRGTYVRCTVGPLSGWREYIAGVEMRVGDDIREIRERLRLILSMAASVKYPRIVRSDVPQPSDDTIAQNVENAILGVWPDRAYFLEICHDEQDGWVQVYQPWRKE